MNPRAVVLSLVLLAGCTSHHVALLSPATDLEGNCFEQCSARFGARPTLHCGPRKDAGLLVCAYDRTAPGTQPWQRPPETGEAGVACRSECERAGYPKAETCWRVATPDGTALACGYEVGYH